MTDGQRGMPRWPLSCRPAYAGRLRGLARMIPRRGGPEADRASGDGFAIARLMGDLRIPAKYLPCPGNCIRYADSAWLRAGPELQVLRAVVVSDAVAVVHGFFWQQVAAEDPLHDEDVLKDVVARAGPGMAGRPQHHVAGLVPGPAASPAAVRWSGHASAGSAGR